MVLKHVDSVIVSNNHQPRQPSRKTPFIRYYRLILNYFAKISPSCVIDCFVVDSWYFYRRFMSLPLSPFCPDVSLINLRFIIKDALSFIWSFISVFFVILIVQTSVYIRRLVSSCKSDLNTCFVFSHATAFFTLSFIIFKHLRDSLTYRVEAPISSGCYTE